ncbi:MAG: ubiquinol-cytochrome c reductase cytochrome c1 subunit [Rhodospirillaceae bacterium]|nr:MAG: ubiquinol-cytochrome c reductase cytochrome c1 subunit [Rhodospirillaceae bacterium]
MRRLFILIVMALATPAVALASSEKVSLETQHWSWQGLFGSYDQAQLKRGFKVYKEICASCHALGLVAYRNLADIGFAEEEIKAIAAEKEIQDGPNDMGEMFSRSARPSDPFVSPYSNDPAARVANNGALPPDLSLIAKARAGGPDYLYSLLVGYAEPPTDITLVPGMSYNRVFPGHQIAMPQPLFEDMVSHDDGTSSSLPQLAKDVTAFLNWTAEPELNARHSLGLKTLAFLILLTALFYALKRQMWSDVH